MITVLNETLKGKTSIFEYMEYFAFLVNNGEIQNKKVIEQLRLDYLSVENKRFFQ